jgi:tetratricopeptide (TPR) repeat protein
MNRHIFKNILFSCLFVFAAENSLQAQTVINDAANSWLRISPSVRNTGMGESLGAVPETFDEVDVNPAGIGLAGGCDFSFSQSFWAQGLSMQHLVYSQRLENNDGFSLGADYVGFGNISLYTVSGSVITANGSYAPSGLNIYGGYGIDLIEGLRGGLTVHFIYDNIQPTMPDQTAAFDGGLFYQMPGTPLSLSAVLKNAGWNLDDSSLPIEFEMAWAYRIDFEKTLTDNRFRQMNCLTLSGEGDWSMIDTLNSCLSFGGEYWYKGFIALRAGYRFGDYADVAGLAGFSLGAGIRYLDWQLDYAMTTIGDFGTSNQISLSLMLGETEKTPTMGGGASPAPTAEMVSSPTSNPTVEIVSTKVSMTPTPSSAISTAPEVEELPQRAFNPKSPMWKYYRNGIAAYRVGKSETAARYFKKAASCPNGKAWQYAEFCAMLGVINEYYVKTRVHLATARHYYQFALRLDPENKIARLHLRKLRKTSRY